MKDKLLIEVEMFNREAQDGVRALVFLANELSESATIHITDPEHWYERRSDEYQLRWRFAEDALSSWEVVINADLAAQLNEALRTAESALHQKKGQPNDTLKAALATIESVRLAFTESMIKAEPKFQQLLCEA